MEAFELSSSADFKLVVILNRRSIDPTSSQLAALSVQLRRSREAKGLTQEALGALVNYSNVYISNVETAKQAPSLKFVALADEALGAGGALELLWWSWKNGALLAGFPEYTAKEADSTVIRLFELNVVPGLLQAREYAAAYESAPVRRGVVTQGQAEERLEFLIARQRRLQRSPAPTVHAVIDESCLHRPIGGRDVMVKQLAHLERLAGQPNVIIQVAPYELAEGRPFAHPITLLTLPNRTMLGYTETPQRGFLERDADTVGRWAADYDLLQVEALSRAASLALVRDVRKELENHAR